MAPASTQLPKYVVLRSRRYIRHRNYLQYLWTDGDDDDDLAGYNKGAIGCIRDLDIVNPFVKLEVVVPSTSTSPFAAVHLLCSCNNKYLEVVRQKNSDDGDDLMCVSATADRRVDDPNAATSTLFEVSFLQPSRVSFYHRGSDRRVAISTTTGVAMAVPVGEGEYLDYFRWESYQEKVERMEKQIKTLGDVVYLLAIVISMYVLLMVGRAMV